LITKNCLAVALLAAVFWASGCSGNGGKVRLLETELQQEKTQKLTLQTRVDSLRAVLAETRFLAKGLESESRRKDEIIKQFAQQLDSLKTQVEPASVQPGPPAAMQEESSITESLATQEPAETPPVEEPPAATARTSAPPLTASLPEAKPAEISDYQAEYDRALGFYRQQKFHEAMEIFAKLLESNRDHKLAGNCQYWIGECCYGLQQFETALAEFQKVLAFPRSYKIDTALFKIGLCYARLKKYPEARQEFEQLITAYPASEYVERARSQLNHLR